MSVGENIEFALRVRRMRAEDSAPAAQGVAAPGRARRHGRSPAFAALRRPAAACGGRARTGAQARSAAARRAIRRARREDSRGAAPHDPPGAARAEDHDRARHARPGRSVRARRPDRRDEPRPLAGERSARRAVRPSRDALRRDLPRCREPAAREADRARHPLRRDAGQRAPHREARRRARARSRRGAASRGDRALADARQPAHQLHRDRRRRGTGVHRCAGAHSRAHDQRPVRCAHRQHVGCRRSQHCSCARRHANAARAARLPSGVRSIGRDRRATHSRAADAAVELHGVCRGVRGRGAALAASVPGRARGPHEDAHRQAHRSRARYLSGQRADAHLRRCSDCRARESRASRSSGCFGMALPK